MGIDLEKGNRPRLKLFQSKSFVWAPPLLVFLSETSAKRFFAFLIRIASLTKSKKTAVRFPLRKLTQWSFC